MTYKRKLHATTMRDGSVAITEVAPKHYLLEGVELPVRKLAGETWMVMYEGAWREAGELAGVFVYPPMEKIAAQWPESMRAEVVSHREIDQAHVPQDRTYRNAWRDPGRGALEHDMDKARELHRQRLREARAPLLARLDVDYQRADERGDAAEKARIATQKQALRDAPAHPVIDAAKTIDELAAAVPPALADTQLRA